MSASEVSVVLTIAGTDPSGGAGVQADLKTFTAHNCYGCSAVTAVVSQNTTGVRDVHPLPPAFVQSQVLSVLEDMQVHAIKTGMLFDQHITAALCNTLRTFYGDAGPPYLVVDPVCVSTSGHTLLNSEAMATVTRDLFPMAYIVTPNRQEAERIIACCSESKTISTLDDLFRAALELSEMGPKNVLLKGGHLHLRRADVRQFAKSHSGVRVFGDINLQRDMQVLAAIEQKCDLGLSPDDEMVVDMLFQSDVKEWALFVRRRIETSNTHGTGCTLSASIACYLSRGYDVVEAVRAATDYTHVGIETAPGLGKGNGPLNHMHSISQRPLLPRSLHRFFPLTEALIASCGPVWHDYVQHTFVQQLGQGTLHMDSFKHFIKQDYLYLKYYARAYGLLAAKSNNYDGISAAAAVMQSIVDESRMHIKYCEKFGIMQKDLQSTPESTATAAYGRFLLDVGIQGDFFELFVAFMACLIGYGEVGLWLMSQIANADSAYILDGNPYKEWIESYSGDRYQGYVREGIESLELLAEKEGVSDSRLAKLVGIWKKCTLLEKGFWDMAMRLE